MCSLATSLGFTRSVISVSLQRFLDTVSEIHVVLQILRHPVQKLEAIILMEARNNGADHGDTSVILSAGWWAVSAEEVPSHDIRIVAIR